MVPNCTVSQRGTWKEITHMVYNLMDRVHMKIYAYGGVLRVRGPQAETK